MSNIFRRALILSKASIIVWNPKQRFPALPYPPRNILKFLIMCSTQPTIKSHEPREVCQFPPGHPESNPRAVIFNQGHVCHLLTIPGFIFPLFFCNLLHKPDLIPLCRCGSGVGWGEGALFKKAAGKEREETWAWLQRSMFAAALTDTHRRAHFSKQTGIQLNKVCWCSARFNKNWTLHHWKWWCRRDRFWFCWWAAAQVKHLRTE